MRGPLSLQTLAEARSMMIDTDKKTAPDPVTMLGLSCAEFGDASRYSRFYMSGGTTP